MRNNLRLIKHAYRRVLALSAKIEARKIVLDYLQKSISENMPEKAQGALYDKMLRIVDLRCSSLHRYNNAGYDTVIGEYSYDWNEI